MILLFILLILIIVADWKIFTKAGVPGWYSLVPFLNMYTLSKIAWGKGWYFFLLFIPVLDVAVAAIMSYKLALSFGKDIGYTIGLILLPFIFHMILGFGSAEYIGPGGVRERASGTAGSDNTGAGSGSLTKACLNCGCMNSAEAAFCRQCGQPFDEQAALDTTSDEETEGQVCMTCGALNNSDAVFCKECGTKLETPLLEAATETAVLIGKVCASCGTKNDADALFCAECGSPLEEKIAVK